MWDWCIVVMYLTVSLGIGLYVRKYATTMTSYIAAGRGVGVWLGVATMSGTEMGLITVMYNAEKGFKGGFAAFHIGVLAGLVTLGVGLSGFIVGPLREQGVLTIPEYYERRFGRKTRILGGIVLALGGILNMGLFLKVGSMFIVGVTGLSHTGWALPLVMTTLLTLVLVYTVLGGMISVVVTDYVQFVVLSCGMLLATGLAIYQLGWNNIFDEVQAQMGIGGFDPLASSAFGTEYVAWQAVLGLVGCAVWPDSDRACLGDGEFDGSQASVHVVVDCVCDSFDCALFLGHLRIRFCHQRRTGIGALVWRWRRRIERRSGAGQTHCTPCRSLWAGCCRWGLWGWSRPR